MLLSSHDIYVSLMVYGIRCHCPLLNVMWSPVVVCSTRDSGGWIWEPSVRLY